MMIRRFRRITFVILSTLLLTGIYVQAAENLTVTRDGSLIFASPDNSSAVMDILSRGTVLQVVEQGSEWHLVRTSDGGTEGYIRNDAVGEHIVPGAFSPDSVRVGSPQYLQLQRSLDGAQQKMQKIASTLDAMESRITYAAQADSLAQAGSRLKAGAGAGGMLGQDSENDLAVTVFYGAMVENTDFAAGLSAAWFPGLPAGLSLEVEAGAIFPEGVDNIYWGQAGVRCPLERWERIIPYASMGAGMIRRQLTVEGAAEVTDTNMLLSAGGGVLIRLAGAVAITADVRYIWELEENATQGDGRGYLGVTLIK
jgi:hypothetical protein